MKTLFLDFETHYSQEYSLSKMTNESYIRDSRFEVILVSIKADDKPAFWVPAPQIKDVFKHIPWNEIAVGMHHSHFDAAILSWIYDIHPLFLIDTLPMVRCLFPHESASLSNMAKILGLPEKGHEVILAKGKHLADFSEYELQKYGEYSCNDTEICYSAFQIMKKDVPLSELQLISLTSMMFTEPIFELDPVLLREAHADELERKEALLAKVNAEKVVLSSNQKFAELLVSLGHNPPKKISPAWRKKNPDAEVPEEPIGLIPSGEKAWAYALGKADEGFKQMLESEDPVLSALAEARAGVKSTITETRIQRLIGIASRGTLPVYLKAWGCHTGRMGAGDRCNLQNLPRSCSAPGCDGGKISG